MLSDARMLEDLRSRLHGGPGKTCNIARRIAPGADFIDHATVINGRSDLGTQLVFLNHPQRVVELAGDDLSLPGIIVEMLLLAGNFQMTAPGEVAVNLFLANDLFDAIERSQRSSVHTLGPFASVHRDELVDARASSR